MDCLVCGRRITGRRADALYCGGACQQKAHRARTAERIAALIQHIESLKAQAGTETAPFGPGAVMATPIGQAGFRGKADEIRG